MQMPIKPSTKRESTRHIDLTLLVSGISALIIGVSMIVYAIVTTL